MFPPLLQHPHIERLFESRLAPFLSQASYKFWRTRLHYFREGLYYQGGMVSARLSQRLSLEDNM